MRLVDAGDGVYRPEQPTSFREVLQELSRGAGGGGGGGGAGAAFTRALLDFPSPAVFLELPPLTSATAGVPFECRILAAPALEGLQADESAFAEHFRREPAQSVFAFANVGGDALLVSPAPASGDFAHLKRFLQTASAAQVERLWQRVGEEALLHLRRSPSSPLWISTSGLGVSWLHVRLDSAPKYYQSTSYKSPSWGREESLNEDVALR